jgi:acetylornithine deacetylase
MNSEQLTDLIVKLTSIPSVTGEERAVMEEIGKILERNNLKVERIPVEENRWNIFVAVGTPRVILTTHVDVVPAPAQLFNPRIEDGKIFARGSCDAKGIAACMIAAFLRLLGKGRVDIGLLLVVGEEYGGDGAVVASKYLTNRGIQYLINGEPTESKLAAGHKGFILFELIAEGRSCHSGYPELGIDANRTLIDLGYQLYRTDFGYSELFGAGTINLGVINAGVAHNIVSPRASAIGALRTVTQAEEQIEKIRSLLPSNVTLQVKQYVDPVTLKVLDGYDTYVASYVSDIPNLAPIGAEALLYGPGSIHVAHTDHEYLEIAAAEKAVDVYCELVERL